jgi:hypothetical protein
MAREGDKEISRFGVYKYSVQFWQDDNKQRIEFLTNHFMLKNVQKKFQATTHSTKN